MPEKYYEDEWVTLYHGDALEVREWQAADVLVTDPPYGMDYLSNMAVVRDKFERIEGDDTIELRDSVLDQWHAFETRPALVFGTWRVERPARTRHRLVWAKGESPGMGDLKIPWGHGDEEIYVQGGGWIGKRRTNVYRIPTIAPANNPGHPTPKPVPLIEALLEHCPEHWVIADPFAGSGATLLAARNLGRVAVGVELEEKYCEVIARRLERTPLPMLATSAPVTTTGAFDLEGL